MEDWLELIPKGVIDSRVYEMAVAIQTYIDASSVPVKLAFVAQGGLWLGYQLKERLCPDTMIPALS